MNASFFAANRRRLLETLDGGLAVLTAHTRVQRANDMAYLFQQESNFWYLSGISEPDWLLIIDGMQNKSWLVMPNISDVHQTFDGGMDASTAKKVSGVDRVISGDESTELLRTLARRRKVVYTLGKIPHADAFNFSLNPSTAKNFQMLERTFETVRDCRRDLAKLRAIKQPEELDMIEKAVSQTTKAFKKVYSRIDSYKHEYEIEAEFSYMFRASGARGHAYEPIVASGVNACTLHYSVNNAKLNRGLVLMDVGASHGGYAADITRTYAKGEATKRQIEVHAAVEQSHKQIIGLLTADLSIEEYQSSVDIIMTDAIKKLGLYKDDSSLRRYMPHAISHGLGIDVHDSLGGPKYFEANMVITVEPGIYIPEEAIGVRIEDDIVITTKGSKNMSASLSTGL